MARLTATDCGRRLIAQDYVTGTISSWMLNDL
jgi:hypothetical protein